MTSNNLNKFVRSNINLKPWILSKNTSEIVNTCIQKIYKQTNNQFRNELVETPKTFNVRPENKAPIRSIKTLERTRPPTTITMSSRTKNRLANNVSGTDRLLSAVMSNSKKNTSVSLAANKRFLKSPNYKIYSSRRFGSSASSSNASFFRRYDDRRRRAQHNMMNINYLLRTFGTSYGAVSSNRYGLNTAVTKYLVPARNQQMEARLGSVPNAIQVSSAIQNDLMPVDNIIKDRISLARHKLMKYSTEVRQRPDPMEGWHHPPSPDMFRSRANERNIASAELQEQYRRLKIATKAKQFENIRQMEKRSTIGAGSVGKKLNRARISEEYINTSKELTPRAERPPLSTPVPITASTPSPPPPPAQATHARPKVPSPNDSSSVRHASSQQKATEPNLNNIPPPTMTKVKGLFQKAMASAKPAQATKATTAAVNTNATPTSTPTPASRGISSTATVSAAAKASVHNSRFSRASYFHHQKY